MATCTSCEATIVWMVTTKGKAIPVDAGVGSDDEVRPKVAANGNLRRTGRQRAGKFGRSVDEVERVAAGTGTYITHFSTCPNAPQHRRS